MMNRIRDIVRKKREGIPFDVVEEEKEERDYSKEYKDDNLPLLVDKMFEGEDEKFEEQGEYDRLTENERNYLEKVLSVADNAKKFESGFKGLMGYFEEEPIYQEFLKYVRGIGPVITANLINMIEYCEDYGPHISNLWSYAGLAPGQKKKKGRTSQLQRTAEDSLLENLGTINTGQIAIQATFLQPIQEETAGKIENG